MEENTISICEFIAIAHVKESTIKKNAARIPGLEYSRGRFKILKGTRYPGDFHRYKLKDSAERRYVLLKAISEYKYINHQMLRLHKEQFDCYVERTIECRTYL